MCTLRGNSRLFGLTAAARILYNIGKEAIFMTTQEVARLIEQGGRSGYILGSDCSIHNELPEERIRWVADVAHRL